MSPHGHTEPRWYAENLPFPDPGAAADRLPRPLCLPHAPFCQGIRLEDLGVPYQPTAPSVETDGRTIWRLFAENYYLFRGTPTRMWFDHTLETLFGITERLTAETADAKLRNHHGGAG